MKWVKPQNIHLTLKFLGEINAEQSDQTASLLKETADNNCSFIISLALLDAFPGINAPRIIWLGIDQGELPLKKIAADLEDGLTKIGIPAKTQPFSAHITLARNRSCFNQQALVGGIAGLNNKLKNEKHEFTANKLTLFRSTLTPLGPIYEALQTLPLGNSC